ncbi:ABC transporter substrate-binding protein [Elioraea rosea]|uniref:ABC transporter substrate-binding protein n=1 Tax=Elioraea rosea TaxID=2492390 RepID=UPI001185F9B5|nr:ABC transporter substrate-binding protein [Elioraea rosea]
MSRPATAFAAALLGLATLPAAPALAQLRGDMTLMAYTGIFQENYTAVVVEPFKAANPGVNVTYFAPNTSAVMLGTLRSQRTAPQADVVIMDITTAAIACAEGLVEKLTPAEVPVMEELVPLARQAGGECGPAVTFDHFVIVYDTTKVSPAPTSLRALWNEQLRGRIAISAPPNIQGLVLTAIVEKMEGGDYRRGVDKAIERLRGLAPLVQTFDPRPDGYSLILNDQVTYATGWNARSQLYRDQSNGRIGVMLPEEGTAFQINTINVVKGGPNRAAALAFVNHALSQPAQKAFTERMFYGPTNARAEIAPEALARTAAAPEYRDRVIDLDWADVVKLRDTWNNRWRREVISAGGR